MNVLVFDIETIPDIEGGQKIYDLEGLDDKSTAKAMFHIRQQKTGSEFLPLHLQKIVAISVIQRVGEGVSEENDKQVSLRSLGTETSTEAELLQTFIALIETHKPKLVSWNGSCFDFPIINYRLLKNSISAKSYLEKADDFTEDDHTDLKNVLAHYNKDAKAPLNDIAKLLGFPGKIVMDGESSIADGSIWDEYRAGNIKGIREDCEIDVLNIYLIYLRYQLMCGELNQQQLEQEFTLLRDALKLNSSLEQKKNTGQKHLGAFLKAW